MGRRPARPALRGSAAILAACIAFSGCTRRPHVAQDSFLAMESVVQMTLVAASDDAANEGVALARREVARLESVLSDYRPESNVGRINRRETDVPAPETRVVLERARTVCRESGGAFDVTTRPVKRLWGFGTGGTPHVPDSAQVRAALAHVGCDTWSLTPEGRFVWHDDRAEIDLGGIAQGYVAGVVAESLQALGLHDFLIDVSGDIVCGGRRADGRAWRIGVQHPRRPDSLLTRFDLDVAAVTTSGDYEQFFVDSGRRYHHIFDPATGWPASRVVSATVLADDPVAADCYAKVVFVLGPERGLAFLDARPDLRGLLVTEPEPGRVVVHWSDDLASRAR
jgi:thiamine biosynthesis lipoprotein